MIIRGVICQSLARWLLPTDATIHRYDTGRTSPRGRLASLFCCPMRFDGIESMEAYLQFRLLLSVSSGQCSAVHQTHLAQYGSCCQVRQELPRLYSSVRPIIQSCSLLTLTKKHIFSHHLDGPNRARPLALDRVMRVCECIGAGCTSKHKVWDSVHFGCREMSYPFPHCHRVATALRGGSCCVVLKSSHLFQKSNAIRGSMKSSFCNDFDFYRTTNFRVFKY